MFDLKIYLILHLGLRKTSFEAFHLDLSECLPSVAGN